ncbi:dihydroorotate dehydrogenase [Brockia lithotrophica]|uniref:Dihydroorotate dehydrogenase n=1 Tax=Brockia lithotrophica TaxID=933949 RepID=A0A660L6Q6_9BACL|nr:dihydroorotate dehydrogenase [Brockia lithotrophica]RKQ88509.1 dihydroorotate oxidase B catalytic subunit [Brockia lithotrophica]
MFSSESDGSRRTPKSVDLTVSLGPLRLANPVLPASGTFGYGLEAMEWLDLRRLGAVVLKSTSLAPRPGHRGVRVAETPCGMLNAIGLENPGVREALALVERLPEGVVLVASIFGNTEDEYAAVAEAFSRSPRISALEINLSCPNVAEGGLAFGRNPEGVARVTARVRAATSLPLWVKLSPDTCDVVAAAKAANAAGADALVLGNTMPGLAVDRRTYAPVLANVTGGLSGPALKPISLRLVYEVYRHVPLPIIGVGGISDAEDVLEFLAVGASAVQVGTAALRDPFVFERILAELPAALRAVGVDRAASFVGIAHRGGLRALAPSEGRGEAE